MLSSSVTRQRSMVEISFSSPLTKVHSGSPGTAIPTHFNTSSAAVTMSATDVAIVAGLKFLRILTMTPMNFRILSTHSMLAIIGASCSIRLSCREQSVGMPRVRSAMPWIAVPVGNVTLAASGLATFGSDRSRHDGGVSACISSSGRAMSMVLMRPSDRIVRGRDGTRPRRDPVDRTAGDDDVVGLDHQRRLRADAHDAVGHDDAVAMRILDAEGAPVSAVRRRIGEADLVAVGRADHALARIGRGRAGDAVPHGAEDVGMLEVSVLERDHELVADLRHEIEAAALTGVGSDHRGPGALQRFVEPRERDL